jgi:hypothetical protein
MWNAAHWTWGWSCPQTLTASFRLKISTSMDLLVWGESLLKHRTILAVSLIRQIIDVAGREIPVNAELVLLGEEANIPWDVRLFPFVVIITIMLGGMMVPATSLVEEKVKRTYRALLTTPASLADILTAKGLTGVILALFNGVLILYLNNAFGTQPATLIISAGDQRHLCRCRRDHHGCAGQGHQHALHDHQESGNISVRPGIHLHVPRISAVDRQRSSQPTMCSTPSSN